MIFMIKQQIYYNVTDRITIFEILNYFERQQTTELPRFA